MGTRGKIKPRRAQRNMKGGGRKRDLTRMVRISAE
jgi:hypothetical protein